MPFFRNLRKMLKKPVPRLLLCYSWGSTIVLFAIYFFSPLSMSQKQMIAVIPLLPFIGMTLLELCLLVRERRFRWFLSRTLKLVPLLLLVGISQFYLSPPEYRWKFVPMWPFLWFTMSLWAHWCVRLTKRGYL